jgi:serine/threonine protein kinase
MSDPRKVTSEDVEMTQAHSEDVGDTQASKSANPRGPSGVDKPNDDNPFGPPKKPGEVGTLGTKYRVLKRLSQGGMGSIYLGYDERLKRRLAIKVMLKQYAEHAVARQRFLREASVAVSLKHANVVEIYDADEWNGVPYLTMEYLQGVSLDDFLKSKGAPGIRQTIRVAREVCEGLAAAHKLGLVHRDIKPGNIFLEAPNGKVKILDFGLVKSLIDDAKLTTSGSVVGTPAYMSPEQARGKEIDQRSDLFSLGAVLYRTLTGKLPFEGASLMDMLVALSQHDPKPIRDLNPRVSEPMAQLIHELLRKKPEERPQSAEEVLQRLKVIDTTRLSSTGGKGPDFINDGGTSGTGLSRISVSGAMQTGDGLASGQVGETQGPMQITGRVDPVFEDLETSKEKRAKNQSDALSTNVPAVAQLPMGKLLLIVGVAVVFGVAVAFAGFMLFFK